MIKDQTVSTDMLTEMCKKKLEIRPVMSMSR